MLVKKINDKIRKAKFVDSAKRNEDKVVSEKIVKEEFTQQAKVQYQQILDLIERYQRLDSAILNSNANTFIETSYGKYSVASAIALRGRLLGSSIYDTEADFEGILYDKMHHDYAEAIQVSDTKNHLCLINTCLQYENLKPGFPVIGLYHTPNKKEQKLILIR